MDTEPINLGNEFVVATGERVGERKNIKKLVSNAKRSEQLETVYETLEQVRARFASSGISIERVAGSAGLSEGEAANLLARDGF
jgi:hypothetical protein